jgi:hypothetical protein
MASADDLASFQAAILELLAQDLSASDIRKRLGKDAAFAPFCTYVESFEPRMLAMAAELVKKWGRRQPDAS